MAQPKKRLQLGMDAGTASGRLLKSLLFHFATKAGEKCFRCGGELDRDSFTVDHKEAWLDSGDPVGLFFSVDNIAFSHWKCNVQARRTGRKHESDAARRTAWATANRELVNLRGRAYKRKSRAKKAAVAAQQTA
jgi:hypothetical protein